MQKSILVRSYEAIFLESLISDKEVVVPWVEGETLIDSLDKMRQYVLYLIQKYGIEAIDDDYAITGCRYTDEHGHHYWVRRVSRHS